ncbi:hypothetical protein PF003_g24632 [Phytophthora fragariae]|nr:hypothetical protein PF003_g24632 [Phytophthora fragariae]
MQSTNFSEEEINMLWRVVEEHVVLRWNVGRGKKCKYGGKDVMFMMLTALKHCGKWDVVASVFKINPPTFQKMIMKFTEMISPFVYARFVEDTNTKWSMRELVVAGKTFSNFACARYATDVTFQQANIPYGLCEGRSIYFSGKHKLHGYKVEVSVLPTGKAINCTSHHPGHVSDIEIFRRNQAFHSQNMKKSEANKRLQDEGPLVTEYPDEWAHLADKGYQGLSSHFRAITPNKKQPGETLSIEQLEENDRIAHDRVLVENYFGRLTSLWAVASDKYRWSESSYDTLFRTCVALTNFHVHLNPLRSADGDSYSSYLGCLLSIGEDVIAKRKTSQKRYRNRREHRLRSMFRVRNESSETLHRSSNSSAESDETVYGL